MSNADTLVAVIQVVTYSPHQATRRFGSTTDRWTAYGRCGTYGHHYLDPFL